MKKQLLFILLVVLLFMFAACGSSKTNSGTVTPNTTPDTTTPVAAEHKWRLSSDGGLETIKNVRIAEMIKRIETESNGRIQITHSPANQMGTFGEVYEQISQGLVEMSVMPIDTFMDADLDMNNIDRKSVV